MLFSAENQLFHFQVNDLLDIHTESETEIFTNTYFLMKQPLLEIVSATHSPFKQAHLKFQNQKHPERSITGYRIYQHTTQRSSFRFPTKTQSERKSAIKKQASKPVALFRSSTKVAPYPPLHACCLSVAPCVIRLCNVQRATGASSRSSMSSKGICRDSCD